MMRWWWFGPSVTRPSWTVSSTAMADAGLGGVEVAYVYPLGSATTEFGSDEFLADLRFAADRAHELGLRFDLTLGSGWSFGGPHITDELAARSCAGSAARSARRRSDVPAVALAGRRAGRRLRRRRLAPGAARRVRWLPSATAG